MRNLHLCLVGLPLVMAVQFACSPTPTRSVRRMAEAAANPNSGADIRPSDIHVITLNQLLSGSTFTCPAHREVRTQRPGRCPICASELVAMPKPSNFAQLGPDAVRHR